MLKFMQMHADVERPSMTWIPWYGGGCPEPSQTVIEARTRYGTELLRGPAGAMRWSHDLYCGYGADDIVAYRLSETT